MRTYREKKTKKQTHNSLAAEKLLLIYLASQQNLHNIWGQYHD